MPPCGMASRAFTPRLMITCSSWLGSARTRPSSASGADGNGDVLADDPLQQLFHFQDQPVEIEHARLQQLLAAEGQELPGEPGGLVARLVDELRVLDGVLTALAGFRSRSSE